MIYGTGIDLVHIKRIEKVIERWGDRFIHRVFTPGEIKICYNRSFTAAAFSLRFAAKEAFLKAIGTGWGTKQSPKWQEIEVAKNQPPAIKLSGKAQLIRRWLKASKIHLSLTHTKEYAAAVVILEKY